MQNLISHAYSKEEAAKFERYILFDIDMQVITRAGKEILTHIPPIPFAGAHMSYAFFLFGLAICDRSLPRRG
jgi:hypothetical protein